MGNQHGRRLSRREESLSIRLFYSDPVALLLLATGLLCYGSLSLINHFLFRTAALDLGVTLQSLFLFVHGDLNHCTLFDPPTNPLTGHFTLVDILILPLYYIFGSYSPLIFQLLLVPVGFVGIYILTIRETHNKLYAQLVLALFFLFFGFFSAYAFDYHSNVTGVLILPWFILYARENKWNVAWILLFFILLCRESMGLWLGFLCLAMYVDDKQRQQKWLASAIFCLFWFLLLTLVVMPFMETGHTHYKQVSKYSLLGNTLPEVIKNSIKRPAYILSLLFENPLDSNLFFGVKTEFHLMLMLSGGVLMVVRPAYLIGAFPLYFAKLCSDSYILWGVNYHYSVEFALMIALAAISWCKSEQFPDYKKFGLLLVVCISALSLIYSWNHRISPWYNKETSSLIHKVHYTQQFNTSTVRAGLSIIPPDAAVCATSELIPRLAFRKKVYAWPVIQDAEYLALMKWNFTYPDIATVYHHKLDSLCNDKNNWEKIYEKDILLILRRLPKNNNLNRVGRKTQNENQ